ncbi:hypothetical protein AGMMS49587_11550 [Spirochaetia bacterium]|nr:hypothetical protein AGMMS49587_11550 [Spirochaetia bacterium]
MYPNNIFDIAWTPGQVGWGMDIAKNENNQESNLQLLNIFVEHKKTNIGIGFSPFRMWNDYTSFFNFNIYYNLFNAFHSFNDYGYDDKLIVFLNDCYKIITGPFISINYLTLYDSFKFRYNTVSFNTGMRFSLIARYPEYKWILSRFGSQIFNIETGYHYNNTLHGNNYFYFNISTDITFLVLYIFNKATKSKK